MVFACGKIKGASWGACEDYGAAALRWAERALVCAWIWGWMGKAGVIRGEMEKKVNARLRDPVFRMSLTAGLSSRNLAFAFFDMSALAGGCY